MAVIRLVFLWHMHQPLYKDLVTGEYRLPWVRMHALKDYYGMVKLLDEFPNVHQTFNLVPSLITQLEDYVNETARDPFYDVAAKPAADLSQEERIFALRYLFQANHERLIGRYPRYRELLGKLDASDGDPVRAEREFSTQDIADLQILSQLAWFDEYFLTEPELAELAGKGRDYDVFDQKAMLAAQRRILSAVLPAYRSAAERGIIEISTSPFYHPILPLLCDTDQGRVSAPGLPLPRQRFRHPEDAREQLERGLAVHERVFGMRPRGCWPSEGSVSDEVLRIGSDLGLRWMATDEGVLGRTLRTYFERDYSGRLHADLPERLYNIYRWENDGAAMNMVFRDHTISDLIGFVYSGMDPLDAASHFLHQVKQNAFPALATGRDAVVSVILDGENAWEHYHQSGREFLRTLFDSIDRDPVLECTTVSEAIDRHREFGRITSVVPGSWINANFNVWIGAPEDNLAWDYLSAARDFYAAHAPNASAETRALAFEELMIAEGSDWNWWYGPEHHSANDSDFDDLYRKHLRNIYEALGAAPPDALNHSIIASVATQARLTPQTAFISPRVAAPSLRYFDWMGAAVYRADRHGGAMHGKQFLMEAVHAGIDATNLYCRIDFAGDPPAHGEVALEVTHGPRAMQSDGAEARIRIEQSKVASASLHAKGDHPNGGPAPTLEIVARLTRVLQMQIPLSALGSATGESLHLRATLYRDKLPLDSIPPQGTIELPIMTEQQMRELTDDVW